MKIGIVGLPNVGKSTLFNAFMKRQQALSANYPFATIEPNIGVVDVPDLRVDKLAELSNSDKKVYANITFVDIAGIVEGAHKGEGLGNQFLANIRETDLILILLRDFEEPNIVREGSKEPGYDYEIILSELILKDLETIATQEKRIKNVPQSKAEINFKEAVQKIKAKLNNSYPASETILTKEEAEIIKTLNLLTSKPLIKLYNVDEAVIAEKIKNKASDILVVSAKIESEIASLSEDDQKLFLADLNLEESPLNEVIKECYKTLDLSTFLTTGKKESRAWKFKTGSNAKECAGVIHSDFEKNFIKAEVCSYDDFASYKTKNAVKEAGKLRLEGKDYIMKDGDVVEFKVGA